MNTAYSFKSVGCQTNLMLDYYLANVEETSEFFVITTPNRPDYFWGNYLLMKTAPEQGDYERWIDQFAVSIGRPSELDYCAIAFDMWADQPYDLSEFTQHHFNIYSSTVLTSQQAVKPNRINHKIAVQPYDLASHIDAHIDLHFDPAWPYGDDNNQINFLRQQAEDFCRLIEMGVATRYGALKDGLLVADLGVVKADHMIRFNSVATHRSHRREGICSTLTYEVSKALLQQNKSVQLVMEADESYHAAAIYESVGFIPTDKVVQSEWTSEKIVNPLLVL